MNAILRQHAWKPGQSGNPSGKVNLPPELKAIKALSVPELVRIVSKYGRMNREELQAAIEDAKTPALHLAVASILAQSIKRGDYQRLNFLLDRAIGKVPVAIEDQEDTATRYATMTDAELAAAAKEKLAELNAA